ncbi:MAG: SDR family oxidoreductase [Candidatus Auribacterota bacterium]|nr:SDR family oxidoreductase [Candidatus Auribacterota bacterium]
MTILITGASGFLGWNLFQYLKDTARVIGTYGRHRPQDDGGEFLHLDIRETEEVNRVCRTISPDIIIHTAAMTSPGECMKNQGLAREINVTGTEHIARAADRAKARLISISTDRVFSGEKGNYKETDPPGPRGHYGKTKLSGEEIVKNFVSDYIIFRLPLMYGPPSPFHSSFLGFMLDGFVNHSKLELFQDQFRTPLYVEDAGWGIKLILARPELTGLYHLGGSEKINRSDFGYRMADIFGFDPSVIQPTLMTDKTGIPPTPADATLNSDKFFQATGFRGRNVTIGLQSLKSAN